MSTRFLISAATALCLATGAGAFPYGNAEGCARHLGTGGYDSDRATLAYFDRIEGHESSCPVINRTTLANGDVRLMVECSGEGETWQEAYIASVSTAPDSIILYREDTPQYKSELTECSKL